MALFSNQDIYNTYQSLLGQGMTYDQILAAAQRNPNINLTAADLDAALAQYQPSGAQTGSSSGGSGEYFATAMPTGEQSNFVPDPLTRVRGAPVQPWAAPGVELPKESYNMTTGALQSAAIPGAPAPYSLSTPNITNEDILQAGRTRLQAGADPQSLLNELAANPSATQEQIQSAYNALTASGYSGLSMPGAKSTTMPVTSRATADTGMTGAGTTGAATTGAATTGAATTGATTGAVTGALPAQGVTLTDQLLNAFTQGQRTGNYGTFQSLLRQSKASASDIAAMFPQLSEQNVMDFAKQYGLSLEAPTQANISAVMRDPRAESASSLNLAKQLVSSMGPGYEQLLSDPKLLQQMREGAPTDYQQLLLGGFNAAQRTGNFAKFNKMLADRDISETELRTLFPNITNAAIDEFKKRGLQFSARPDWLEEQRVISDQNVAGQIADKWKQEFGRDISPDELRQISYQIGNMPTQADAKTVIGSIKNTPLNKSQTYLDSQRRGERFIPNQLDLQKAGLSDLLQGQGFQPQEYDWDSIMNSKDPRSAIIASNRQLAAKYDAEAAQRVPKNFQIVGNVSGIPITRRKYDNGQEALTINGAAIGSTGQFLRTIYQLGLTSDDLNKIADIADKQNLAPATDLRDVAAGGFGTETNPLIDLGLDAKGSGARDLRNQYAYFAEQLGLARNPSVTAKEGYKVPYGPDLRPIYDKKGNLLNYAAISGGGVRYFSSADEAAQFAKNFPGSMGQVINLTGRSPTAPTTGKTYRPGEKIISPGALPTIGLYKRPGG